MLSSDSTLTNATDIIGTSQVGTAGIVSISINNTISIDPSHGAKLNEPSWTLLPSPRTMTQTMHYAFVYGSFEKIRPRRYIYVQLDY